GAPTLSNSELLALLIGSGTRGVNAMQLARQLLRDGVEKLAHQDVEQLASTRGIGPAKAARIAASFELSRRCQQPDREEYDLVKFAKRLIITHGQRKQERLGAAILDGSGQICAQREIFVGTVTYTVVSTRELIQ